MRTGVILVGHGSREPYNKEAIEYFASILRSRYDFVSAAFMQINKPTIEEKLRRAIEAGVDKIIIQPVFLTTGVHINCDIPKILGIECGTKKKVIKPNGREVQLICSEPIGKDLRIIDILIDRISSAERST